MAKQWIQGMHMKKGALHSMLHVPQGDKIPAGKVEAATHSGNPLLKRRAILAQTLGKMHKK